MHVIEARNVNDAYTEALWKMNIWGKPFKSRNGDVLAPTCPVATVYRNPWERMLFDVARDANPFFHVMEAMWMLDGRNDVTFVKYYAKNMESYSDDTVSLNGAYGYRWRKHFFVDQIQWVIDHLIDDSNSRRAHIAMWDPMNDTGSIDDGTKDVPCNTSMDFRMVDGELSMTVYCRSNDIIWGCYGANAVHMSYLQEYIAIALGVPMGTYTQVSNNWHIYEPHFHLLGGISDELDPYTKHGWVDIPLFEQGKLCEFTTELTAFLNGDYGFKSRYIAEVLTPLRTAWDFHKLKDKMSAMNSASLITDSAVKSACLAWLSRRTYA